MVFSVCIGVKKVFLVKLSGSMRDCRKFAYELRRKRSHDANNRVVLLSPALDVHDFVVYTFSAHGRCLALLWLRAVGTFWRSRLRSGRDSVVCCRLRPILCVLQIKHGCLVFDIHDLLLFVLPAFTP